MPDPQLLDDILAGLDGVESPAIAVLGDGSAELLDALGAARSDLIVHRYDVEQSNDALHTQLCADGRFDAIIDATRDTGGRPGRFRGTLSHLRAGGLWVVADLRPADAEAELGYEHDFWPYLCEVLDRRDPDRVGGGWRERDPANLAESTGRIIRGDRHIVIVNRLEVLAKLRERQMNELAATTPEIGRLVSTTPAATLESRARIFANDPVVLTDNKESYTAPPLAIREYSSPLCVSGGIAIKDHLLLPETFRHNQYSRLTHTIATSRTHYFATMPPIDRTTDLEGTYFYLDNEYRSHFGHFLSEQISRLWALPLIRERYGDVKILMSHRQGKDRPADWELEFLSTYDVRPQDVVSFTEREAVRVERLIGCTPMYSMPDYVHPGIADVWTRIGDRLEARASDRDYPERVFLSRGPDTIRPCHNADEVERRFNDAGFVSVLPEQLPLPDQVALFRRARMLAGYAGSAMLGMLYRTEPVTGILVGPDSYRVNNESLVAAVRGNTLVHVVSVGDFQHPPDGWSWDAFYGGFSVDWDREGRYLDHVLGQLDAPQPDFELPRRLVSRDVRVKEAAVRWVKPRVPSSMWNGLKRLDRRR